MQGGKPKTSRGLTAVLIAAFLGLSVLVLLVTNLSQALFRAQEVRASLEDTQRLIAREAANTVRSFVQEKFGKLEAAVRIGKPVSASPEQQENILGSLLGLDPAFRQLALLDPQERELAMASRLTQAASGQLLRRGGSDLFAQVRQGNRYISPVYVDDITSEPLVVMAIPATDAFGDFQGALLAEVNLRFMWDLVGQLRVGETGQAYVVDRQGNLIAHGDISRVLRGENASHLELVSEFIHHPVPAGEAATGTVKGISGSTVVGAYASLGMPDWAVVTELPMAEALQSLIRSVVIGAVILVAVVALDLWLAVYLARRLATPILSLTDTATRIAGGEISLQAEAAGPTEVVRLATAFNVMTAQLRELIGSLEQRVVERTYKLQAAAEVGRATTAVLDLDQLLRQTVDLVRERLGLYYVGLFLLDEQRRFAVLRAGTGQAGRQMLGQGHKLEVGGASMIGQCVASGQARIALDVGAEAVHFDNPLLPETRSEMALPLRSRGQVIGAITVQSSQEAAFDEADIVVMQTMADQVAVAIDNARLFQQVQESLEAERRAFGELSRQAWAEILRTRRERGYHYSGGTVMPASRSAAEAQRPDGGLPRLELPIKYRGRKLGSVVAHKPGDSGGWTPGEIELMETLAERLSVALESARLYQDTQRHAAEERLIGEVTARLRETLDVQAVLETAADELYQALGLEKIMIGLAAEGGDGSST